MLTAQSLIEDAHSASASIPANPTGVQPTRRRCPRSVDTSRPLSTNSQHPVVTDATHASLLLDATDADIASQAIRDVVR